MFDFKYKILFHLSFLIFSASMAWAGPQFFTYEGYIEDKSVPPVPVTTSQSFLLQIKSPTNCVLYQETQTIIPNAGNFSLQVGTGIVSAGYSNADIPAFFSNEITISSAGGGCSYTPAPTDSRSLVVSIFDTGAYAVIANISLSAAPFALNTERVGGRKSSAFLKIVDGGQTGLDLTSLQVTELYNLITGASTRYVQPSSSTTFPNTITFSTAPQFSGTPGVGSDLTNKTYVDNAVSTAVAGVLPNVGTAGTYFKVITDSKGRVTSGSSSLVAADIPSLPASIISSGVFPESLLPTITGIGKVNGGSISGTIGGSTAINSTGNLYTTGTVTGGVVSASTLKIYNGINFLQFTAPTLGGSINWILPNADGAAGQVLKTDGLGNLSWVNAGSLANLNGAFGSTQWFANGVSGASPNFSTVSATNTHTLNIPMANAAASVTAGLISKTEYVAFNGKLGTTLPSGQIWVGSSTGSAQAQNLSGDATISNTGALTVNASANSTASTIVKRDGTGSSNFKSIKLMEPLY